MTRWIPVFIFAPLLLALSGLAFTVWTSRRIKAAHPPAGQFVDVEGARMHYVLREPEAAPRGTIVLVHGASGNEADLRAPLAEPLLARGFRVISIDRPGHGWSVRDSEEASPARQALQIRQAIERTGVKGAVVAGHSLAGALTLQLALDHSDLFHAAMLIAPVTHPWPGGVAFYYRLTAAPVVGPVFAWTAMTPLALTLIDASLESVFAPQSPPAGYRARTGVELVLRPETFRANARDVVGMHAFVSREQARYGEISIPVDIVTGDSDTIVLTHIHSYGSARDIPRSTLHVMPGVGHSPHWARPEDVAERIAALAERARGDAQAGR